MLNATEDSSPIDAPPSHPRPARPQALLSLIIDQSRNRLKNNSKWCDNRTNTCMPWVGLGWIESESCVMYRWEGTGMDGHWSSGGHVVLCSNDSPCICSSRVESIQYEVYVKPCVDDAEAPEWRARSDWNAMAVHQSWPSERCFGIPHDMVETIGGLRPCHVTFRGYRPCMAIDFSPRAAIENISVSRSSIPDD
jgi:hypothetical protein